MSVFRTLAEVLCDYWDYKDEQEREYEEHLRKIRAEREEEKRKKQEKEHEIWLQLTAEEHKNPEEFRVLPYGWSPFGIIL